MLKMAETIKINSNIKVYAIENENGEVLAELRLDPSNDSILGRFMDLYDNLSELSNEASEKIKALGYDTESQLTVDQLKNMSAINNEAINGLIAETDAMFGAGFTKEIFADNYKADPDYIPNIIKFQEFYGQVMPIIEAVYKNQAKNYSVKKG